MQAYSDPSRESETYSLPDVEIFQLTAEESVEQDEYLMYQASKRFPLMHMNSRDRAKAIAWAVEESGAEGGYFYWYCFPGCLPEGPAIGPFRTANEALEVVRDEATVDALPEEQGPDIW
jgi:hypothetical protein